MIKVKVLSNDLNIKRVSVKGHAMYDDYGKDIVCAACSSIVTTTVNAIIKLDKKALTYENIEDGLDIEIINTSDTINTLMLNMIDLLKELENDYPNNISISKEEK